MWNQEFLFWEQNKVHGKVLIKKTAILIKIFDKNININSHIFV